MDIDMSRRNKRPRPLSNEERSRLDEFVESIHYSNRYNDSEYEYRHVQLPKAMLKAIPEDYQDSSKGTLKLLWEEEWRALGITQVRAFHRRAFASTSFWLTTTSELGMGTLRGPRARAAHPSVQAPNQLPAPAVNRTPPPPHRLLYE